MIGGAFGYGNADARPYRKIVERKKPDNSVNLGELRKSLQKKKQIRVIRYVHPNKNTDERLARLKKASGTENDTSSSFRNYK